MIDKEIHDRMLFKEFNDYLYGVFSEANIYERETLPQEIHVRFVLGGDLKNGTKQRVQQGLERALEIFRSVFSTVENEIYVLIYEWDGKNPFNAKNEYLYEQFLNNKFKYFNRELVTPIDPEEVSYSILVGKIAVKDISIENILRGIANLEMGFHPGVYQCVYFFDPSANKVFHMYDDRGCFVWSDEASKILDLYKMRNSWIVEYHRSEIDAHFQDHI